MAGVETTAPSNTECTAGGAGEQPSADTAEAKDDIPAAISSSITVAVRVRPLTEKELGQMPAETNSQFAFSSGAALSGGADASSSKGAVRKIISVLDERMLVFDPPTGSSSASSAASGGGMGARLNHVRGARRNKDVRFAFDRVFSEDATQEEVFAGTPKKLIGSVLNGYNATVFAYGATGCGKTHTISGTPSDPGIIFLTMRELFERIRANEEEMTTEMSISYLEVYNETIRDLLVAEGTRSPALALREDQRGVMVAGLSEHHPQTPDDVMSLLLLGNKNRTMSPTCANAVSSRSHAVLQVNVRRRPRTASIDTNVTVATMSVIDLAGSERASVTKNTGERLLEGANINRSLLALGNCINALCDARRSAHIPYRDSKLTRLLKFSLGGNCQTVMIVCVSPFSAHYEETHNTLKYANRAKNIKTNVARNTVSVTMHVSQYRRIISELKGEVAELKRK
ncbi:P-loop containing nucleoside triphosphate hydrolase protein, partial [Thamnocephalis sphaerospora]